MNDAEIGWIAAIIIGGLAGWLAEMFMKSGTGILTNIVLGIVGAAVANFLLVPHRALPDLQRMKLFAILRPRRRHRGRYSLGANERPLVSWTRGSWSTSDCRHGLERRSKRSIP